MKVIKERARAPLVEVGSCIPRLGFDSAKRETTFIIECNGDWVQGKGYTASYSMHLSKEEALSTMKAWIEELGRQASQESKRNAALTADQH